METSDQVNEKGKKTAGTLDEITNLIDNPHFVSSLDQYYYPAVESFKEFVDNQELSKK